MKNADGHFVCPHCQAVKKNQSTMYYHLKKHEGDLPHACKHCDMKFLQKYLLDLHMNAKHKEKVKNDDTVKKVTKFACTCEGCDQTFLQKGNVRIHFMRMHMTDFVKTLKKPQDPTKKPSDLYCGACDKTFNNTTTFFYHTFTAHKPPKEHRMYDEWKELVAM